MTTFVEPEPVSVIPSGFLALDAALGAGGYPCGRIVEVSGPEPGGRMALALHAIAGAQCNGGIAAFVDAEHALDIGYARAAGVNPEKLLVSQPDTGEQALEIVEMLARTGTCALIVIGSVELLVPAAEISREDSLGLQARLMSQALRKLTAVAHRTGTTLMFLRQEGEGGNALKFYASVRLDVRRIGTGPDGCSRVRARVVKNKVAPPFGEAEIELRSPPGEP